MNQCYKIKVIAYANGKSRGELRLVIRTELSDRYSIFYSADITRGQLNYWSYGRKLALLLYNDLLKDTSLRLAHGDLTS